MSELQELTDGKTAKQLAKLLAHLLKQGEALGGAICAHVVHKIGKVSGGRVVRFVLTCVEPEHGMRALMQSSRGQHTYATPALAQEAMNAILRNNSIKVLRQTWGEPSTYEVRPALCYAEHFDPVETLFDV